VIPLVAPDTTRNRPRRTRLGRALRLHAQSARHRTRRRALLTKAGDGRAGLRPDQGQPTNRRPQTKRPGRRPLGMAPNRCHPQSVEAPPTHLGDRNRLSRGAKAPSYQISPFHRLKDLASPALRDTLTLKGARMRLRSAGNNSGVGLRFVYAASDTPGPWRAPTRIGTWVMPWAAPPVQSSGVGVYQVSTLGHNRG
jgi:hypothetical protein